MPDASPAPVGRVPALSHLLLFWRLRLWTAMNRGRTLSGAAPALAGSIALGAVSLGLGLGTYRLMSHPVVAESFRWSSFLFRMIAFLTSAVFVVWPILAAGVDEHSELSRFATFPIKPLRLFVASSLAALVEPRALAFYPPVLGAVLGYRAAHPFPLLPALVLVGLYFLLNTAWSRAWLTLVLNVLRHRRSAEILGVGFLGTLFLAALVPPIDARWVYGLFDAGGFGAGIENIDDTIVVNASRALGELPTGAMPSAIQRLAWRGSLPLGRVFSLVFWTLVGFTFAYRLLLRFYANTARPSAPLREAKGGASAKGGPFRALVDREAADWLRNPKARMLVAVPFFLCILLRIVSARDLVAAATGRAADAWLLGALCSYAGLVVAANFAQNAFAYDGPGLALLYAAPVPMRLVFLAKNAVHAAGALAVGVVLTVFYALYVHLPSASATVVGVLALAGQLPLLLTAGNLLSVLAPRKFHASLRRRDRPPALGTFGGLAAAAVAVAPMSMLLRSLGKESPGAWVLAALVALVAVGWAVWAATLPLACRLLEGRREKVLRAVVRE